MSAKPKREPGVLRVPVVAFVLLLAATCGCGITSQSTSSSQTSTPAPLAIATTSLPSGSTGVAYSPTLKATGGTAPYKWQLTGGQLPPGLTLATNGQISGTPTTQGNYKFSAQVTDSSPSPKTASGSFTISIGPQPLTISTTTLSNGTVATTYNATLQASGGTSPYGWIVQSGNLPPGLGLTSAGQISGTPTTAGAYNFTTQVSDSSSPVQTASAKLSITIAAMALAIGTTALPTGTLNTAYTAALSASGGTTPYTWSVASGSLPAGLSLSSSGQISGTPTAAGTSSFSVRVSDTSNPVQTATANESIQIDPVKLDMYGGRTDITCSTGATGYWSIATINGRDWFCDPLGNAFNMHAVEYVNWDICHTDAGGKGCNLNRFSTGPAGCSAVNWANATAQRLLSWGFNAYGTGAYASLYPWQTYCSGLKYLLPTTVEMNVMPYVVTHYATASPNTLDQPVKMLEAALPSSFTGWVSTGGFPADIYDPRLFTFAKGDAATGFGLSNFPSPTSSQLGWVIGAFSNDSDLTFGLIDSLDPNYLGSAPGKTSNSEVFGWVVAIVSPLQYGYKNAFDGGLLYPDPVVYTKQAWANYLSTEYGTISALNAAWGSNYTTFGSSGTPITGEGVGTGDGTATNFSHTLSTLTPSKWSVGIFVGGKLVGADQGNGTIWGPALSGTIDYSTGALSLTFSTAPASGAAVTVNYTANGWCLGTGVLDECYQSSHQSWMGTDSTGQTLAGANANLVADAERFSGQAASKYLSDCRTALHDTYPHMLFFGPDLFIPYGAVANPWVMQAIAGNVDAIEITPAGPPGSGVLPSSYMAEIAKYAGDIPLFASFYTQANPDSELSGESGAAAPLFSTQATRGQYYESAVQGEFAQSYPDGVHPYVGTNWWRYYDDWSQMENWGLVTARDNAYDGVEDTGASVSCAAPLSQYTCGGDLQNTTFGNLIEYVQPANQYWLAH